MYNSGPSEAGGGRQEEEITHPFPFLAELEAKPLFSIKLPDITDPPDFLTFLRL